jgi:hypothetical protein
MNIEQYLLKLVKEFRDLAEEARARGAIEQANISDEHANAILEAHPQLHSQAVQVELHSEAGYVGTVAYVTTEAAVQIAVGVAREMAKDLAKPEPRIQVVYESDIKASVQRRAKKFMLQAKG